MKCKAYVICLAVGLSMIVVMGIIGWWVVNSVVRSKIAEILPLRNNTESWDRWENLPVPIAFHVYIFHVNNPHEILAGKLPNVTEVGPYVYKERRIKTVLSVDEEKSKATYQQKLLLEFDQEASGELREDDVHTVVNVVALLFSQVILNARHIHPVIRLFNTGMKKMWPTPDSNPLFIKAKVKDYLFGGLPILCNQTISLNNIDTKILCEAFRLVNPKTTITDDFGKDIHSFAFFKYKNNSYDGTYEIDLGIHDVTKIGQIKSWNNMTTLSNWRGESCNRIVGTDATIFRPYLQEDGVDSLSIYHTDVCRSLKLTYETDAEYKGVTGRRYVSDKNLFSSVLDNNDNYCFCPQSVKSLTSYPGCLKSGVLELSSCHGAPVIISHPHFLMADSSYQDKVMGLKPDFDKHRIFLDLEQNTGYPLRARSRIQINSFLKTIPEVELMKNLPNVLMPVLWLEEKMDLTDDLIDMLNSRILNILKIVHIIRWSVIGIGISLTLGSCAYYFLRIRPQKKVMSKKK